MQTGTWAPEEGGADRKVGPSPPGLGPQGGRCRQEGEAPSSRPRRLRRAVQAGR